MLRCALTLHILSPYPSCYLPPPPAAAPCGPQCCQHLFALCTIVLWQCWSSVSKTLNGLGTEVQHGYCTLLHDSHKVLQLLALRVLMQPSL